MKEKDDKQPNIARRYSVEFVGRVHITAEVTGGVLDPKELHYISTYDRKWLAEQAKSRPIEWEVENVTVGYK